MEAQGTLENRAIMDHIPNLAQKVFGMDLLRETILNHAIRRRSNGQLCGSYVTSLLLVQKSWLETITHVLQKSKEPLFKLVLTRDNSLQERVGQDGKLLDRFLNAIATKPSLPTFSVKILEQALVKENHSSLSRMLVHFGSGLVQLEMQIPAGNQKFILPNFTLPSLRKLCVKLPEPRRRDRDGRVVSSSNVSNLINSLLNAAPALTQFIILSRSYHNVDDPLAFEFFTLPPSITTLELSCHMTSEHLHLLLNDLPNLTSLTLFIPGDAAYPDGLLFGILDKCRTTLRKFRLRGRWHRPHRNTPRLVTSLRFPVMEKLEEFSCHSINCELEAGTTSSLETRLPKLARLVLTNLTADMFRKWTEDSYFISGCDILKYFPAQENARASHPDFLISVNLEMMQSIHLSFPNVRNLEVTVRGSQVCGLKYLFLEMKTLDYLTILVVGSTIGLESDFWDALLTGVPIEFVKAFRGDIEFWERGQLRNPRVPSIKNLKELKHLRLGTHLTCVHDPSFTDPLISDLTFLLGLLQMPKLRELTFNGKFQASDGMAERWRSRGRKLVYSAIE